MTGARIILFVWVSCVLAAAAAPANNMFANRTLLSGTEISLVASNIGAWAEDGEPAHAGHWAQVSVWWTWTAPYTGTASFRVLQYGALTPIIAVYTGNAVGALTPVASKVVGFDSTLKFPAIGGRTYQIAVDDYYGYTGEFEIRLALVPGPANDNFAKRIRIEEMNVELMACFATATTEPGEPYHRSYGTNNGTVWWTWTAPTNGRLNLETVGRISGLGMAIYTGSQFSSLVSVSRTEYSMLAAPVQAGTTYQLVADRAPPNTYGFPSLVLLNFSLQPYPPNDAFTNRIALGSSTNTVYGNTFGATSEPNEPYHAGHTPLRSIWWTWTAPASGRLTLRSRQSEITTSLGVYVGTSVNLLQQAPGLTRWSSDRVDVTVSAGVNYHIAVDSDYGAGGIVVEFERWQATPPPSNDSFNNPLALTGTSLTVTGSLFYASKEPGEPLHANHFGGRSVWYTWTAVDRGLVTVTAGRSGLDYTMAPIVFPLLAVYRGSSVSSLTSVASDSGVPNDPARCQFSVQAGQSYAIAVDDDDPYSAWFVLALDYTPPPANDLFANRIEMTGENWTFSGSTIAATKEAGEPNHAGSTGTATVWYAWSPLASTPATLTVTGTFNTVLAVYHGSSVSSLTPVAANDDYVVGNDGSRVTFPAQSGTNYMIAIAGRYSTAGDYRLWLTYEIPPFAVTLTAPQTNMVLGLGSDLTLSAQASDGDGEIVDVEFRNGTNLLATVTHSPWMTILTNISPGDYSITATAIDNDGNATSSSAVTVRVPPENDNFAGRIEFPLDTNEVHGTIGGASREAGEPTIFSSSYKSVWWRWTAPSDGNVVFVADVLGYGTFLSIHTGTSISNLSLVAKSYSTDGRITFRAAAGVTYNLCVESYSYSQGAVTLSLLSAPANDNFADRIALNGATNWVITSNLDATAETGEPKHANYTATHSLWWSFTAPEAGMACFTSKGKNFNTSLAAYRGGSVGSLVGVASNYSSTSKIVFPVMAGTNYAIGVDSTSSMGQIDLGMSFTPLAPNDNFAQATSLEGDAGRFGGNNVGTTKEPGEPNHANYPGGHSVWYRWVAPASGFLTLSNVTTKFSILLGVYRGTGLGSLSTVAAQYGRWSVVEGTDYFIAIDSYYFDEMGAFTFDWSFLPLPTNDYFTNRFAISGYTNTSGYNIGATNEPGEPEHGFFADGCSVWYEWTATEDAGVSMAAAGNRPGLAIYTGTSVSNLTLITKSDELGGNKILSFRAVGATSYAVAVDSTGSGSGYFSLSVFANEAPLVSVTSPASNSVFHPGEDIAINIDASDPDGTITNLALSLGSQVLTGPPYTYVWSGMPLGSYTVKAVASDNLGAKTTSTPVVIHVRPVNDNFGQRLPLLTATPTSMISTNASKEVGEPNHAGKPGGASLWWTWTAPASGRYCLTTRGSTFDTLLAVHTGTALSNLSLVASNDNANPSVVYSELIFEAHAGDIYQIAVDGWSGGNSAEGIVQLVINPAASNDSFENRAPVSSLFTVAQGSNVNASHDPNEPWHGLIFASKSLWWTWTAPHTGSFTFSTKGSGFDTVLAVYSGAELTNLVVLGSNDDSDGLTTSRLRLDAAAGTEYQIGIAGYGDSSGDIQLRILANNPPALAPLDLISNAAVINFSGEPGVTNALEVSTNLVEWAQAGSITLTNTEGLGVFTNTFSPAVPMRYYRVKLP